MFCVYEHRAVLALNDMRMNGRIQYPREFQVRPLGLSNGDLTAAQRQCRAGAIGVCHVQAGSRTTIGPIVRGVAINGHRPFVKLQGNCDGGAGGFVLVGVAVQ